MAFQKLEDVGLLNRVYSSRSITLPIVSNQRKRAKLITLDIGIVNYILKQRKEFLGKEILGNIYKGSIAEQFIGQALIGRELKTTFKPNYWYRDKAGATAEVDFLIMSEDLLIPIEVKNSNEILLRSMESFVDESFENKTQCKLGVQISANSLRIEKRKTSKGRKFDVVNVPFYVGWRVAKELISLRKFL